MDPNGKLVVTLSSAQAAVSDAQTKFDAAVTAINSAQANAAADAASAQSNEAAKIAGAKATADAGFQQAAAGMAGTTYFLGGNTFNVTSDQAMTLLSGGTIEAGGLNNLNFNGLISASAKTVNDSDGVVAGRDDGELFGS